MRISYKRILSCCSGDLFSYIVLILSLIINRFWIFGDIAFSVFRGVPNFYSWILLWNCRVLETLSFSSYWAGNAMFPYKNSITFSENMIGLTPVAFPFRLITDNPVLFTNIFSLFLVILTMLITFKILKYLSKSRIASLAGTLIFSLYPWSMKEFSLGRFHMLAVFFIPIIVWLNIKYYQKKERKFLVFISIVFVWTLLSNIYIGVFLTLFIALFNIIWLIYDRNTLNRVSVLKIAFCILIAWIMLLPIFLKYLESGKNIGMVRTLSDQVNYTGPASSWLTVPDENLLYGKLFNFLPKGTRDGIVENYMFPGIAAIFLFIAGFFLKKIPPWVKSIRITGLVMILISVGPFLRIGSIKFPMPFSLFWYIFPPMRATRNPHRFAIFALFCMSVVGVFVLKELLKKKKGKLIATFIIIPFILLESQSFQKVSLAIPRYSKKFYSKLSSETGKKIVAELPFEIHTDLRAMSGSTWHWHSLVNGVSGLRPPAQSQLEYELKEFPSLRTIKILQSIGVNIVVLNEMNLRGKRKLILKKIEQFSELGFLFRIGMKSAWSLEKGTKMRVVNYRKDFSLSYTSNLNKNETVLRLMTGKKHGKILFNPKAPSKFKFTKSKLWKLRLISVTGPNKRIVHRWDWNPPAFFHDQNRISEFKIEKIRRSFDKIFMEIELPGSTIEVPASHEQ